MRNPEGPIPASSRTHDNDPIVSSSHFSFPFSSSESRQEASDSDDGSSAVVCKLLQPDSLASVPGKNFEKIAKCDFGLWESSDVLGWGLVNDSLRLEIVRLRSAHLQKSNGPFSATDGSSMK